MRDEELMLRLAAGEADAADALVARYKDVLFGFVFENDTTNVPMSLEVCT